MKEIELYLLIPYFYMIFVFGIFLIIFKCGLKFLKNRNKTQIRNIDKSIYYRDIPCYESIDLAYWLLYNFSDEKKNDLNNGLLGAYLLNWYKKGYIDIKSSQNIGLKNNNYSIDLKDGNWEKNYVESKIYDFLKTVSGNNNILEKNEIRNYCSVDGKKTELEFMFKDILEKIQGNLEEKAYITVIHSKSYLLFKTQEKITLSKDLINEYQNLNGLKNFLLDYSNIEEKKHIEVHIWENYLIFANLLGIADKVKQQFKKIYPNFKDNSALFNVTFDNTIVGNLNVVYKGFKLQFFALVASLLLVVSIFFGNSNMIKSILRFLPFAIVIGILYWLLKKYLINKKVKEMNKKLYAKITDVTVNYDTERDFETGRDVTTKSYSFTYEYMVDEVCYRGVGISNFKKRKGQHIKIYYNEIKPEKSETAQEHNYYLKMFIFIIVILIVIYLFIKNSK